MPRVSEDHLTARREQILEAARVCFLRNGLHTTSMQDLIREAGLSVGAVYRYFKSKNEIINAIAESVAGGIAAAVQEVADREPPLPVPDAIGATLDIIEVQLVEGGAFPLAVQIWAEATLDPAIGVIVRERYRALQAAFNTIAQRAHDRGELPADSDPRAVASVLFSMIPGYALQRMLIGGPDKETYKAGVRAVISRA